MSLNYLNVGKLKFIVSSLKGLPAAQLGVELDRLCADEDPISFYNCFALGVRRKNILFLGAPGVGVGTCMRMVEPVLMIPSFRSKFLIHKEMREDTEFGRTASKYVLRGELIPDDVVIPKVMEALRQPQYRSGMIIDGFPRTIKQAEALEQYSPIDIAIAFSLPKEFLVKKLTSRRVCPKCNRTYILSAINEGGFNLPAYPPIKNGICDDCGVELAIRSDDHPKIIEDRFDIFEERTKPVLEYYRSKNVLREHKLTQGVQGLPEILRSILIQYLVKYN